MLPVMNYQSFCSTSSFICQMEMSYKSRTIENGSRFSAEGTFFPANDTKSFPLKSSETIISFIFIATKAYSLENKWTKPHSFLLALVSGF